MRALGAALAVVSALLWLVIGYLGLIEVTVALRDSETEHSPLLVLLMTLPAALLFTVASWWTLRRSGRG